MSTAIKPAKPYNAHEPVYGNPACVRFGENDPRTFAFGYLLLGIDDDLEPEFLESAIEKLRRWGIDVTINPKLAKSPETPVMCKEERVAFDRGELLPWMHPKHIGGVE